MKKRLFQLLLGRLVKKLGRAFQSMKCESSEQDAPGIWVGNAIGKLETDWKSVTLGARGTNIAMRAQFEHGNSWQPESRSYAAQRW